MKLSNSRRNRLMKKCVIMALILACGLHAGASRAVDAAALSATKIGESMIDAKALTLANDPKTPWGMVINGLSFQQEAILSHRGCQYVGYYDGERRVCLARRRLPAGPWEVVRFADYKLEGNDCHNTISMGICPGDGTIHLAFDHHVSPLHYRVSRKGAAHAPSTVAWEASLFGPVTSELNGPTLGISYPRFVQTPDGALQMCYRKGGSGDGCKFLVDYDPQTGKWGGTRQFLGNQGIYKEGQVVSSSRGPYLNGMEYGPDGRLHVSWVWRELEWAQNRDLCHAFSQDHGRTWRNTLGKAVPAPMTAESPLVVAEIPRLRGLMNTQGQTVDSANRVHVVVWHGTGDTLADRVAAINNPFVATYASSGAGQMIRQWLNGKSVTATGKPVTVDAGLPSRQGFSVGAREGGEYIGWRGSVGEILVYDSALSDTDRLAVEQYLNKRWIAPAPATAALEEIPKITGLKLRLAADKGVAADAQGRVSRWADQSGNHFDVKQSVDALQPHLERDGINAHPALFFKNNRLSHTGSSLLTSGSPRTVFIVARSDGSAHKYGPGWGGGLFSFQLASPCMALSQIDFYGQWLIYSDGTGTNSAVLGLARSDDFRWGGWPGARRYHHYWREPDTGRWHHAELPWIAGNRPKLLADRQDNLFMVYSAPASLAAFDEFEGGGLKGLFFSQGSLVIAGATAASQWTDWRILCMEPGPFFNEMLGDKTRWRDEGVLSVFVQDSPPGSPGPPTPLRILDFRVKRMSSAQARTELP